MRFACLASRTGAALLFASLVALGSIASWAQEPPAGPVPQNTPETAPVPMLNYTQPVSHFPNPIGPYRPRHLAPPNLANSARIDGLMHDGKLYLSLNDAIALALENNLDIAISRYNLNIADTDVLRARAGASILGVNAGVVLNTPGGGVSGIGANSGASTGGTSLGSGGAGGGTNGLVSSTLGFGSVITSFDPVITGNLQEDHFHILPSSAFTPLSAQNTTTGNFTYTQGFTWGTNLSVGFNNTRTTIGDAPFTTLSPQLNSNFKFQLTQHLLQGFGFGANTRFIRIAKNNRELSDVAFRLQIIDTLDQIENIYWDLVYNYENARVQNESLAFAQKTLSDTKKQVEIGSLAPIEVVRAQSTVAQDQQLVTAAQTNLQLEQLLMKNALSRSLKDPMLATAEVIPTSTMDLPPQEPVVPTEDLINDALRHRAELVESRIDLNSRDLSNKAVRNALLPSLDLYAYYGGYGLGGAQNPTNLCANQPLAEQGEGFCAGPNAGAADRKPGGRGSSQRAIYRAAEPGLCGFRSSCHGAGPPVAGRRAKEISVRDIHHDISAAIPEPNGYGRVNPGQCHGRLREVAHRVGSRDRNAARPQWRKHRRCRSRTSDARAERPLRCAAQGYIHKHGSATTAAVVTGSEGCGPYPRPVFVTILYIPRPSCARNSR